MMDEDEYAEYHESREELRETLADHLPVVCPIGNREDCKYLHYDHNKGGRFDDDDCDYWCEHPFLGEDDAGAMCPINEEERREA